MKSYRNPGPNGRVQKYEIKGEEIVIEVGDTRYLYNVESVGELKLNEMRKIVLAGKELKNFIDTNKVQYSTKTEIK